MSKDDIPDISRLLCACYEWLGKVDSFGAEYIEFLISKRGSVNTIERESAVENYFVACDDKVIVGMVSTKADMITKLYVDPDHHRQGIGAFLFKAAEEIISLDGHQKLTLVALSESSVPFYRAMGMAVAGREGRKPPFPADKRVISMEKILSRNP